MNKSIYLSNLYTIHPFLPKPPQKNELIILYSHLPQTYPEKQFFSPSLIFVRYRIYRMKNEVISTH